MNEQLVSWLRNQINEREWSLSEFARRADLSKSYVSLVFSQQRKATADFCIAAARALHADASFVLGLAGHLPPTVEEKRAANPTLNRACEILESLPHERQAAALAMLHGLAESPPGIPLPAMENAPASTAEAQAQHQGAEPGPELEQMFYQILEELSHPDNPHRRAYDALWDAARTMEEKKLLARMLAAAAEKYERGEESDTT